MKLIEMEKAKRKARFPMNPINVKDFNSYKKKVDLQDWNFRNDSSRNLSTLIEAINPTSDNMMRKDPMVKSAEVTKAPNC